MINEFGKDRLNVTWNLFKQGDQEAFAALYNLHIDKLYRYGTKLCKDEDVVKDALQELFLELFLKREKIKIGHENLKFYLLVALKRNLVKKLTADRKIVRKFDEVHDFEPQYSIEFQMIEQENNHEIERKVANALKQLPTKQKEVVYLRFNESLEYGEIAEILDITIESVRKQVHRALKTIREIIGNESVPIYLTFILKIS